MDRAMGDPHRTQDIPERLLRFLAVRQVNDTVSSTCPWTRPMRQYPASTSKKYTRVCLL